MVAYPPSYEFRLSGLQTSHPLNSRAGKYLQPVGRAFRPECKWGARNIRPLLSANPPPRKSWDSSARAAKWALPRPCTPARAWDTAQWDIGAGRRQARASSKRARGHDAKGVLAQEAKVGYCLCCVQATRIAAHVFFKLGEYSALGGLGMRLWVEEGPWVGRRLAAVNYVLGNGAPRPPLGLGLGGKVT